MSQPLLILLGLGALGGAADDAATGSLGTSLGLLVCLFALSAFFSSSETAIFGLQNYDLEVLKEKDATGRLLDRLRSRPDSLLATILMGNELANVTLASVAAAIVVAMAPRHPWLNVVLVLPLLVLCLILRLHDTLLLLLLLIVVLLLLLVL